MDNKLQCRAGPEQGAGRTQIHPSRWGAALALVIYLAAAAVLAAALSVAVVRAIPHFPESLGKALLRKGPDKIMARCMQGWLVVLLPWLLKRWGWRGWSDLGFVPEGPQAAHTRPHPYLRGIVFGLVAMGGVAVAMFMAGAREPTEVHRADLTPLAVGMYALAALAVGFFEETLARGVLFRVPARIFGVWPAAVVGSLLFSLAHFVETDPAAFEKASYCGAIGAVLRTTFLRLETGPDFVWRAANLALLGGVLCAFVARTGTTWFSIGAHSGFVFAIRLNGLFTARAVNAGGNWWGGLRADGTDSPWTLILMIALLSAALWWPRRNPAVTGTDSVLRKIRRSEPPWERWAWGLLLAMAFSIPFSIAAGQACGGLCLLVTLVARIRHRLTLRWPLVFWPAVAFSVMAVLSVALGPEPFHLLKKTRRLIWFLFIPVTATLAASPPRRATLLQAFVLGSGILGLKILLVNSWRAWRAATPVLAALEGYFPRMVELGSMTAGQMLMLGLLATMALFLWSMRRGGSLPGGWALLAVQSAALVLNFKRGSWFTALGLFGVSLAAQRRWAWLAGLLVVVAASLCCHPVRGRLEQLRDEWDPEGGGRLTMWTRIAPALVARHPLGVGYRCVTHAMLERVDPHVERRRNHLHSNPVQVLVETGWPGLLVYLIWMGRGLLDAARSLRNSAKDDDRRVLARAFAWMFVALLLNGLVEYNFGDTELMMVMAMTLGAQAGPEEPSPS